MSCFYWRLLGKYDDMFRFVQQMIALRKRHPNLMRHRFLTGEKTIHRFRADISWHGYALN